MENNLSVSDLNAYIKGVFDDEIVLHNLAVYGDHTAVEQIRSLIVQETWCGLVSMT